VAEALGTSATQISRLETGARKLTHEWIERLAPVLGVQQEDLIQDTGRLYRSKLVEQALARPSSSARLIERDLLMASYAAIKIFVELLPDPTDVKPTYLFSFSITCHDSFLPLYRKVGKSPELLAAIRQYALLGVMSYRDRADKDEEVGAEFEKALSEALKPDPDEEPETSRGDEEKSD
jgi:transcriptional regulator with XRE-family HTH domain